MNEVINKKVLAASLAEEFDLTKKDAEGILNKVFEDIKEALVNENVVDIYGFGKFDLAKREAREGINPLTKQPMTFAASKSPKFKASKSLKDAINHK